MFVELLKTITKLYYIIRVFLYCGGSQKIIKVANIYSTDSFQKALLGTVFYSIDTTVSRDRHGEDNSFMYRKETRNSWT